MNPEQYEYENDHADRFHDYEEDAMQEDYESEDDDYWMSDEVEAEWGEDEQD